MVDKSSVRVRQVASTRAEEVQFQRWLANDKVTPEEMMAQCGERIRPLVAGRHVLAIQDTTKCNYQRHAGRTTGLGILRNGRGFHLHPVLAVDADSGACLGLVGAELLLRMEEQVANYQALPIEQKDSFRWLRGATSARRYLDQAAHVTVIADRESDIYEEWARIPDERIDLLTRACRDRMLAGGGMLFAFSDTLPAACCYRLDLKAVKGKRAKRQAKMELRFGSVTIKRPRNCSDPGAPPLITLNLVDVREIPDPTCRDEPIHWRLLTTHAVNSAEEAIQLVEWYRQRWQIEQLFRTLKQQGLEIEASQMETADALCRLVALAAMVATRCMQLVLARDGNSDQPATVVFEGEDIPVLAAIQTTLEGKTEKQRNPHPRGSLPWASWIIARLGGWKGYKSESPPGPITMHNGLRAFTSMARGWRLAFQHQVGHSS